MRFVLAFIGVIFYTGLYGQKIYNIIDFGAVQGISQRNTQAIQKAIDKAHDKRGGKVVVPSGVFVIGSLQLRSGVILHLAEGAVLMGSLNPDDYLAAEHRNGLIVASGQQNIAITGSGTIDGQGLKLALIIDSLHHAGIRVDPYYNYKRMRPGTRPMLIDFYQCKGVKVKGITLKDSPSWVQHYTLCDDLQIDSMRVNSVAFWNNDGIDIDGCRNVRITNCLVNSADDGICLKSTNNMHINDHVYIANCVVRSSSNAIKLGTESYGAFKNIVIENIKVFDTYRPAIALESVDGALIENVEVRNIEAVNTGNAIFIRLGHRNKDAAVGTLKNIRMSNVKVQIPFERPDLAYDLRGPDLPFFHNPFPASITGIPGNNAMDITLENIAITYSGRATKGMAYVPVTRLSQVPEQEAGYPEHSMFGELPAWAFYVRHVDGLVMKNINVKLQDADFRPAFVFDDVKKIQLEKIDAPVGKNQASIVIYNSDLPRCDEPTIKNIVIVKPGN